MVDLRDTKSKPKSVESWIVRPKFFTP